MYQLKYYIYLLYLTFAYFSFNHEIMCDITPKMELPTSLVYGFSAIIVNFQSFLFPSFSIIENLASVKKHPTCSIVYAIL